MLLRVAVVAVVTSCVMLLLVLPLRGRKTPCRCGPRPRAPSSVVYLGVARPSSSSSRPQCSQGSLSIPSSMLQQHEHQQQQQQQQQQQRQGARVRISFGVCCVCFRDCPESPNRSPPNCNCSKRRSAQPPRSLASPRHTGPGGRTCVVRCAASSNLRSRLDCFSPTTAASRPWRTRRAMVAPMAASSSITCTTLPVFKVVREAHSGIMYHKGYGSYGNAVLVLRAGNGRVW